MRGGEERRATAREGGERVIGEVESEVADVMR